MLEFTENLGEQPALSVSSTLSMDYEQRGKARQRVTLGNGIEAALFLDRGRILLEGDILRAEDGTLVRITCKPEAVITAKTNDWFQLARACYHIGNRHAAVQLGYMWLRFTPDPVLEELARHLGLEIIKEYAAFEPESGAYHH